MISECIVSGLVLLFTQMGWITRSEIAQYAIEIVGISNLIILFPGIYFYKKDCSRFSYGWDSGKLSFIEILWLLLTGGGIALIGNILITILNIMYFQSSTYSNMMNSMTSGKSMWILILSMGIIGPITEEVIFRWLVYRRLREYIRIPFAILISSFLFGIYHGNLLQFLYATLLGILFAFLYERTQSRLCPILLHIGANMTSILIDEGTRSFPDFARRMDIIIVLMITLSVSGFLWFARRSVNSSQT